MTETQELYVIRKGGYFYRPNAQGYTPCVDQAGRFTLEQAISYSHPNGPDGPRDGISYEPAPTTRPTPDAAMRKALEGLLHTYVESKLNGGFEPERIESWSVVQAARAALAEAPADGGERAFEQRAEAEPVAYRFVHLDYAGRKVSRYGSHAERVNGHDPIEVHPLYAHPQPSSEVVKGLVDAGQKLREGIRKMGIKRDPAIYTAVMAFDAALTRAQEDTRP